MYNNLIKEHFDLRVDLTIENDNLLLPNKVTDKVQDFKSKGNFLIKSNVIELCQ